MWFMYAKEYHVQKTFDNILPDTSVRTLFLPLFLHDLGVLRAARIDKGLGLCTRSLILVRIMYLSIGFSPPQEKEIL